MNSHRSHSRDGYSLIELSAAMAAGSALMILAVGMLHQAFLWSSIAKQRCDDDRSFDRLQRQFRLDVHAAKQATLQQQVLSLTTAEDRTITYTVTESGDVERREPSDSGQLRELFLLTDSLNVVLSLRDQPNRSVLTARRELVTTEQPPVWRVTEAVVGLSIRHKLVEVAR